ncbi:phosphotransferase [Arthrobacter sp. zg-Y1171]|uniref:phosphotransferase n=1 Tax=Arthrobacter sp. zg-Y1171 TaxID=2964610 RepID=UPI002105BD0C|nr:phosphotransferase [Arthrobacter sp. zg-Y1171]MCQ1995755.1 aminoglycoside phosphotransferase family protein [Arthrobacter sp. zg-Y1171]UWX83163.1 aminoglycoside phosphotransferase family protein [Arthrobacter sp. zg-Y1171]
MDIGSAHTVVLLDGTAAVRIARDSDTAAAMRKRQKLVDSIPDSIGFPGGPCPAGEGEPGQLRDLGGHNVFWEGNRIVGVLDWDLASRSDRSTDLACIGVWNGWDKLPLIAGSAEVRRAAIRRNTFRLQQVAFALLNGRPTDEIGQAVARANAWLRESL